MHASVGFKMNGQLFDVDPLTKVKKLPLGQAY